MEKMLITVSDPQAVWLRERAKELDIPVAELVRRVLDTERERMDEQARVGGSTDREQARRPQQPGDDASGTVRPATDIVVEDRNVVVEDRVVSFNRDMEQLYERCGRELGYWANRYLQEVRRKGGLACAKALLARPRSYGLERLAAEGRTDLSVEALVLDPRYAELFSPEERAIASTRLAAAQ